MTRFSNICRAVDRLCKTENAAIPCRLWSLPEKVNVYEVGPRDGLQNENEMIPTGTKVALIDHLTDAGFNVIEATSFVSPKWVPQLADASEVMDKISKRPGTRYPVLVPNMKGWDNAMRSGVGDIAVFVSASDAFSHKNLNCTISESLQRLDPVMEAADDSGIPVRGYVSCAVHCPYSGDINPKAAVDVAQSLFKMGCYEVSMGDTTGAGTPAAVAKMLEACLNEFSPSSLAAHMHDTYGQGLVNVLTSLSLGISTVDSSIAGLGGCPFAVGAKGNVATEDVVYMLTGLGVAHGINVDKMLAASALISEAIGGRNSSRAATALLAKQIKQGDEGSRL